MIFISFPGRWLGNSDTPLFRSLRKQSCLLVCFLGEERPVRFVDLRIPGLISSAPGFCVVIAVVPNLLASMGRGASVGVYRLAAASIASTPPSAYQFVHSETSLLLSSTCMRIEQALFHLLPLILFVSL